MEFKLIWSVNNIHNSMQNSLIFKILCIKCFNVFISIEILFCFFLLRLNSTEAQVSGISYK